MDDQNKLYVAVGKEEGEDRKSVLNWALKFWNGETICVVHVHVPTQKTRQQTRYGFRSPLKTVREVEVNQELERLKVKEMLDDSLNMFALKKVPAEKIVIVKESVTDGILELISQLGIQKLVMGAGANSRFLRIKPKPTSEKSNEVLNKAPDFCHIWFVYKSRLIYTREAMRQLNQHLEENQLNRLSYLEQYIDLPSAESSPLSQNMHHDSSPATVLQQNIIDNDSYDQLQQPLAQAEKVRQEEACEDSERRQKAESEAMKAIHSLKASDEKLNKMKGKINDLQLKIHKGLKVLYQATAAGEFLSLEIEDEEEEEKMFFAEILQKKKKQCDKVQMDYDDTLDVYLSADDDSAEVVQVLEEQVSQEPSSSNVPMFSCEFSQLDIREATMFFDPSLIIHEGDNGIVYKGCLHNTEVAIKILKPDSVQGNAEFKHEVDVLSKLRHPNLVSLIGACHDSLALIYQYLPNGNLEDRLNCKDNTPPLPWQTRIRIAIELCSVLDFLHSIQPCSIIHSDFKPKNILLDANFSCKLSGFSFCHIISNNKQTLTTDELMGTSSYIDPESLDDGLLSLKSDVYCFGIILLRLLTGRPALNIVKEVQHALENDYLHSILDPAAGDWPVVRAQQLAHMALKSCDIKAKDHPNLGSEIWRVLKPVMTSTESFSSPMQPVSGDQIPSYFICPIFQDIMRDPHFAADGFTYEADAVRGWFESGRNTSPMTNLRLDNHNLTPNRALRSAIQEWLLQHRLV